MPTPPQRSRLLALTAAAFALLLPACNLVAPAFYLIHGPEKVPQAYTLERDRPTVIFLDDRAGRISRGNLRELLCAAAERELLDRKALTKMLDSRAATAIASREPRAEPMPIDEIGRGVNAEVVIYITPDSFELSPDGQTFQPTADLRVKVFDVAAGTRAWPEEREGYPLRVSVSTRQGAPPANAADIREAEEEFARVVGVRLAQLFYKHERETASDLRRE